MTAIAYTGELVVTSCWCGIHLAIPHDLYAIAQRNHSTSIYCPLGHQFQYMGETEAEKERRRRRFAEDSAAAARARADQAEASLRTTKGHVTRLRKRIVAGACPFGCHRHFSDLERHVASKHPEQQLEAEA